jgi:predicted metal-dependent HD superfamily phosphohydrolase
MYEIDKLAQKWQACWIDRVGNLTTRSSILLPDIAVRTFLSDVNSSALSHQSELLTNQLRSCDQTQFDRQEIDRLFQLLTTAYTAPNRHYHNLEHIHHLLDLIERFLLINNNCLVPLQDPISVSLAAWFHDFVYDPQASDNELQSAKAAIELLTNMGESIDRVDRVQQLILATKGHQIDPNDADLCIFLDADLAILGADPIQYQVYWRSIRSEYSWVSDEDYQSGRIRVLESFLQRDRLYYTDLLFDELESNARFNMQQEITMLKS